MADTEISVCWISRDDAQGDPVRGIVREGHKKRGFEARPVAIVEQLEPLEDPFSDHQLAIDMDFSGVPVTVWAY